MILLEATFGCYDYGIHYKHPDHTRKKMKKKLESCFSHTSSTFVFEVKNAVGAHWDDKGNGLSKKMRTTLLLKTFSQRLMIDE